MIFKERYLIPLLLLLLAVVYAAPVFTPWSAIQSGEVVKDYDWLKIAAFERFARQSLGQGGLALWCPYFGGGYPLIAHPEDGSLSPLILPSYLFGEVVGMKIQLVIILFLGAWGMFLLARRIFGFRAQGAIVSAVGLMLAGWLAWRVHYGWPMHFGYYLFPFAFYFMARALDDRRWLLAAVATMVVIMQQIAQGLPMFFLFLFLWALARDAREFKQEPRGKRVGLVVALGLASAFAGALKVAGLLQLMSHNPRSVSYNSYQPLQHFYLGLADWGRFVVQEADLFYKNIGLGPWIAFLALAGLILAWKKVWPLLPALVLFVWVGLGPNAPLDLFRLLHKLPVFGSMHWPMKYVNFFVAFSLCIFAGGTVDFLVRNISKRWRTLVLAAALAPMLPLAINHMRLLDSSFTQGPPDFVTAQSPGEFRQVAAFAESPRGAARPYQANMYWLLLQNIGTIDWDGDLLLPENATPSERILVDGSRVKVPEYRGEAYLVGEGKITSFTMGVNRFAVAGTAEEPGLVVINQNHNPAWKGRPSQTEPYKGLLAMPVAAGPFEASFVYRPVWFYVGLAISLLTWLVLGLYAWSLTARKKAVKQTG